MGKFIHFESNNLECIKMGIIRALYSQAIATCSDRNSLNEENKYVI